MARFRSGDTPPDWCELRHFTVDDVSAEGPVRQSRKAVREMLMMTRGRALVRAGEAAMVLRSGQFFDIPEACNDWSVEAVTDDAELLRFAGTWGREIAGCGLWALENDPEATNNGDPVDYPKQTRMDSHYHDYDEYWFILDGAATAVVAGDAQDVVAGDCVAIGAGHHHDMPMVQETMRGAFFMTSLMGRKRLGHLWNHTHGPAEPQPGRN